MILRLFSCSCVALLSIPQGKLLWETKFMASRSYVILINSLTLKMIGVHVRPKLSRLPLHLSAEAGW